ncbi:hypothetical protein [Tropicimonas isoalkanivorans]|uniref:Sulfotransferase family protein n=1 Tax=Tropicimonas isoalkanivorans TaxID=441112 RepID=A0A1I1LKM5_9RHOB|nr:hypothetical protein [Tropicimonas isoalkanivorans]SFC73112.1 hypothetical protein SAMN04488094_108153 [Tropicimonas isoalkanivorans]
MTAPRPAQLAPTLEAFQFLRRNSAIPETFFVMGERCSGTNFLNAVVRRNLPVKPIEFHFWKHGFPTFDVIGETTVILISYRNAASWVRSLYVSPWHASEEMQALDFSAFLRCPWDTVIDNRFMRRKYKGSPLLGLPLQMDRHPITGEVFENVFQMRTAKLRALEGMRNRGCNVVYVRLEDVVSRTDAFLDQFSEAFGTLRTRNSTFIPEKRLGGWPEDKKRTSVQALSDDDWSFMKSQLDLELEARFGYQY